MFFPNWIVLLFNAGTKQGKVSQGETLKFKAADAKSKDTDSITTLKFKVPSDFGRPGAILVEHKNNNEFFLKAITLEMADVTTIHFPCDSWIVDTKMNGGKPRVFFNNQVSSAPKCGSKERKLSQHIHSYGHLSNLKPMYQVWEDFNK